MIAKLIAYGVGRQVKEAHLQACDMDMTETQKEGQGQTQGGQGVGQGMGQGHGGYGWGGQMRYVAADQIDATVQPICSTPLTSLRAGMYIHIQYTQIYHKYITNISQYTQIYTIYTNVPHIHTNDAY
jgi:hypothetical protein